MKEKTFPVMNLGMSLLITIFVTLCLVTFGALSLVSARNDNRSSEMLADSTTAYYEASNQAYAQLTEEAQALEGTTDLSQETSFTIPMGDTKELQVAARIYSDGEGKTGYEVTKFQVETTVEWQGDESLNLLQQIP